MPLIALRGATTVPADDATLLADATRVLLHVNAADGEAAPRHAYLRDAASLRGDLEDSVA